MLATPWPRIFTHPDWVHELKWDGVRVVHTWDGSSVKLRSRRGNDATSRYPELAMPAADRPLVLDGEIVSLDETGRPSFQQLQQRMNLAGPGKIAAARTAVPVVYVVFDLLFDDAAVVSEPWERRRERLEALDLRFPFMPSTVVDGDPTSLWELVGARGLEGIVAKQRASVYRPGMRSADWRKITRVQTSRVVVGGWLPGERWRANTFGSLLVGLWTTDGLRWVGAVGSGFDDASLVAIRHALDEMRIDRSPFLPDPGLPRNALWVAPALVAMVQYKDFTSVGRLRGPSFKGFTDDPPESVTWEAEAP